MSALRTNIWPNSSLHEPGINLGWDRSRLGSFPVGIVPDGGGIYWVPAVYAAVLRRLLGAVEKIGASRVLVLPVHESQDANHALGAIATASLEARMNP